MPSRACRQGVRSVLVWICHWERIRWVKVAVTPTRRGALRPLEGIVHPGHGDRAGHARIIGRQNNIAAPNVPRQSCRVLAEMRGTRDVLRRPILTRIKVTVRALTKLLGGARCDGRAGRPP